MNFFNKLESVFYPTLKKILSIMRLTTLLLIVFSLNISATVYSQNTKLSLDVKNQSIKEVLFLIENQSDFRFIYESGKINLSSYKKRSSAQPFRRAELLIFYLDLLDTVHTCNAFCAVSRYFCFPVSYFAVQHISCVFQRGCTVHVSEYIENCFLLTFCVF